MTGRAALAVLLLVAPVQAAPSTIPEAQQFSPVRSPRQSPRPSAAPDPIDAAPAGSLRWGLSRTGARRLLALALELFPTDQGLALARRLQDRLRLLPGDNQSVVIADGLTLRRLAPDVYLASDAIAFDANTLLVRMPDGSVVFCSSPVDGETTSALVDYVRQVMEPPRMVAINAHFHPDGTAGNHAYEQAGVETYATEATQHLRAERGASVREQTAAAMKDRPRADAVRATPSVPAQHTLRLAPDATLTVGGETIRILFPGPAHSADNVVVHFPKRGLLFGGCLVRASRTIGNTADADLGHWEAAIHALEPLGARLIVPGHGPAGGPELLRDTIEVVRATRQSTEK